MFVNKHNLSQKNAKRLATDIRKKTANKKFFEPRLRSKIQAKSHEMDDFFSVSEIEFSHCNGDKETIVKSSVVFCNKIKELVDFIKERRSENFVHLKIGVDGGRGSLKITLSIQSLLPISEGLKKSSFKDSGVNKIIIIAIGFNVQENYRNIRSLFELLKLDELENYTLAADLKLLNIVTGIQPHSCTFPCCWCLSSKHELHLEGEPRTIANLKESFQQYTEMGSNKKKAKDFKNCIFEPIFSEGFTGLTHVLEILTPPELHLMLGEVNKIIEFALAECPLVILSWIKKCSVQRQITKSGPSFNGNACKKLLDNLDSLRASSTIECLKYVQALQDFKNVVHHCFGEILRPSYEINIEKFKKSYLQLEKPVTPKVHAVFFHVLQFCKITGRALGFYSEQIVETLHYHYDTNWGRFKVNKNHPEYQKKILRSVCAYNSKHI